VATWPSYAEIVWPSGKEQRQSQIMRTPMEHGPAKQAVIGGGASATEWPVSVYFASQADWESFLSWYESTSGAANGAAFFTWTNPRGNSVSARIKGGDISDAGPTSVAMNAWLMNCVLEHWG
jgi:hypothetical protein